MFVVVILGVLAALVVPGVTWADDDARRGVFCRNLKHFQQGLTLHRVEGDGPMTDANSGVCPPALRPFVDARRFEAGTALGGVWDVEVADNGVMLAVGVHFNDGRDPGGGGMARVDALLDDGDVETGRFRRIAAGRYYWVVED